MNELPQKPDKLDYEGLVTTYGGENFTIDNARKVCNYLTTHCKMRDRYIRSLEGRIASEIVAKYQNGVLNVIFDGPPSAESGRFVEVEDEQGNSVDAGTWVQREDGYWSLRITVSDLAHLIRKGGEQ